MRNRYFAHLWMLLFCLSSQAEIPTTELLFSPEAVNLTPAAGTTADKARLLRLNDGTLVAAWHEGIEMTHEAWGLDGAVYAPRDVFIMASADGGASWGEPVNVSNTASLVDASVMYDRHGNGTGLASYPGDSGKATVFASGQNLVITWNDTYCGDGRKGPAKYQGKLGMIEVPYHCLYAARVTVSSGNIELIAVDRLTNGARDVKNEMARGTGAGFTLVWQEDPEGLQLGEIRGDGHGASGAKVSQGTDIWYAWIKTAEFVDPGKAWHGPVPISDNYDHARGKITGGGASRPVMAMAGSPPSVMIVYEERKNSGGIDAGKYVRFHQFPFNAPTESDAGVIVSAVGENGRRARVIATSTPGKNHGTRMVLMWRQGEGIQGAPADFMLRVGSVPTGTDLGSVPNAGFRVADLWPPVDPEDPLNSAAALNVSGAELSDPTSVDPFTNAKAHRGVLDGDFIYVAYLLDPNVNNYIDQIGYFLRWSDDGGLNWSAPMLASASGPGTANIIEPRLIRTPGGLDSGKPEDIRDSRVFVTAWGTESWQEDALEPVRDAVFVTRTVDRGRSFERDQAFAASRTASGQTDEQIQLRITPDGQNVYAVWIRKDGDQSDVMFNSAVGITPTADLSVSFAAMATNPDVGDPLEAEARILNIGPHTATELQFSMNLPPGLDLVSATPSSGSCEITTRLACVLGKLAAGSSATVHLSFVAGARGSWALAAEASAWEIDPEPSYDFAEVVITPIPHADVALAMTARDETVKRGDILEIDYLISNSGPQVARGTVVKFTIPSRTTVSTPSRCQLEGDLLICEVPDIPVAGTWKDTLLLHADNAGRVNISANLEPQEDDHERGDNSVYTSAFIVPHVSGGAGSGFALSMMLICCLAWRLGHRAIMAQDHC